jgi:hypothetical protein
VTAAWRYLKAVFWELEQEIGLRWELFLVWLKTKGIL